MSDRCFDPIGLPLMAHRGYGIDRLIGTLYMTLEGIFGVPLDVAATYIILFTIYGAVLGALGRGRVLHRLGAWRRCGVRRSGAGPGRTVTLAGFLLGTVSGSGVATTVMLGSVRGRCCSGRATSRSRRRDPVAPRASARILSPPTLGAAAFLIAEFLQHLRTCRCS